MDKPIHGHPLEKKVADLSPNPCTWSRSYQTFFSLFFFFSIKLGHFAINNFFLYVTKMQAYQQKTEKFFVSEEKKFDRIDS